jgi:hypothetical protein
MAHEVLSAENRKMKRLLRGEKLHGLQRDEVGRQELWRLAFTDEYLKKTKGMI